MRGSARAMAVLALCALSWRASAAAPWAPERRQRLMEAASGGRLEEVRALLAATSRPPSGDDAAATVEALRLALSRDQYLVAQWLLELGVRCTDGRSVPLETATESGPKSLPLCLRQDDQLRNRGPADPGERFPHEKRLEAWAERFNRASHDRPWQPLLVAASFGDPGLMRPILRHVAVDASTERGWTPLMEAASEGQDQALHLLLLRGAAIDRSGPSGVTALSLASRYGHTSSVVLLLEHGASGVGYALQTAVERRQPETLSALLTDSKATTMITDEERAAAVERAASSPWPEGLELLLSKGAPVRRAMRRACSAGNLELVRRLRRAETSWTDDRHCLLEAASAGKRDVVLEIAGPLKASARESKATRVQEALSSALLGALGADRIEVAQALLELGASARGTSAGIPLRQVRSAEAARLLLEHGADVNEKTRYSTMVEEFSSKATDEPILLVLLDAGLQYDPRRLLCRAGKANMGRGMGRLRPLRSPSLGRRALAARGGRRGGLPPRHGGVGQRPG